MAELKARITKAKRQLLSLKAKLGEATTSRDEALTEVARLQQQVQVLLFPCLEAYCEDA